jgi:hypothetical protein
MWNDDVIIHDPLHMLITLGFIFMLKLVRWDDEEAIAHDLLRMRDGVIVLDDAIRLEGHFQ